MTAVIVVCTGNVCRSPIAEGLLRRATEHRTVGAPITVSSAGTAGWEGSPAMSEAVEAAAEREVDISGHVATRLRPGMAAVADLVLCMAAEHRDQIASDDPQALDRTFTLKELVRLLEGGARGGGAAPRAGGAPPARPRRGPRRRRGRRAPGRGHRRPAGATARWLSGDRLRAGRLDRPARPRALRSGACDRLRGALTCGSFSRATMRDSR